MKKLLIPLLFCSLLTSCNYDSNNSRVTLYPINKWVNLNRKKNNYRDVRVNVSTYYDKDYIVVGVILGKNTTCDIYKNFLYGSSTKLNLDLLEFKDSTGQQVVFVSDDYPGYIIDSTRTIKIDYSKFDDYYKEIIESEQETWKFCSIPFFKSNYNGTDKDTQKVQFGDNLDLLTF